MIKRPLYEGPEERRKRLVEDFHSRYPHPFFAWAERESPFWQVILDRHLTPEGKAILLSGEFGGQVIKVPRMRALWDDWFRAAWTVLVPKKMEGRSWDDLSAEALADAFGLTQGRYRRLIAAEKRWQARQALRPEKELLGIRYRPAGGMLASVLPKLAELPAFDELFTALLTLPTK